MIRWIILAVLIVVVAAAIPLAVNYLPADVSGTVPSSRADEQAGPPPLLTLADELTHDFGIMSEHDDGVRGWILRNEGEGPLSLRFIEKPCTCTGVTYGDDKTSLTEGQSLKVEPGEEVELFLAWETRDKIGEFSTFARFATNDYEHNPAVSFTVKGIVSPAVVVDPPRLDFPMIPSDDEITLTAIVYSPTTPELQITSDPRSSRPDKLVAEVRPLDDEQLAEYNAIRDENFHGHVHETGQPSHDHDHGEVPPITAGYLLSVTLKPGLPLGRFSDVVTIKTDHPIAPVVELPLSGQIVGPISAMPERVYLTGVDRKQGRTMNVALNVRNQDETNFSVRIPDTLKEIVEATVEPVVTQAAEGDNFRQYRLIIRVPAGAKSGMHKGVVVLETDHPQAEEVKVPVEVLVRGG